MGFCSNLFFIGVPSPLTCFTPTVMKPDDVVTCRPSPLRPDGTALDGSLPGCQEILALKKNNCFLEKYFEVRDPPQIKTLVMWCRVLLSTIYCGRAMEQ